MRLKSWVNSLLLALVAIVAIGIVTGVHVTTQAPFLVNGSSSGSAQVVKSTSNALWVSIQGAASPLLSGNGTVSAPQYSFTSNTSAGMWNSSGALGLNGTSIVLYPFGNTAAGWTFNSTGTLTQNVSVVFASLGTPANGTIDYCSDCAPTTPATCPATKASCVCAGSGTGALAVRLNGVWDCGTFQ